MEENDSSKTPQSQAQIELPRYRSHKEVRALKIKAVGPGPSDQIGSLTITPEDPGFAPFVVDRDYVRKHVPQPGMYYVVYQDGYKSASPAAAFEEGYTRL